MTAVLPLVDQFALGLDAPICLTWELTYACNLACVHCLSSSGVRDPRELTTQQCEAVIDELQRMKVFYVNIGGGEPTVRPDFWHLLDYAVAHQVGVKFSTNGVKIDRENAARIAATDYVDVQISLDGATAEVNDAVRGAGSYATALGALENLAEAGFEDAKISVVVTRHNVTQLDEFKALADRFGATLRLTRLRPSGRGADVWDELHPTAEQQRVLYDWLVQAGDGVLTGDSFFHLAGFGEPLAGLNLCGAGRVVCLIDPVGDVYACPFAIHSEFLAGNLLRDGGFHTVWRKSPLFEELRRPQTGGACAKCAHYDSCRGGCMAAKFFTGLPLDGPDPECIVGYGEQALADRNTLAALPRPDGDHSHGGPVRGQAPRPGVGNGAGGPVPVTIGHRPNRGCDESPLVGLQLTSGTTLTDPVVLASRRAPSRVLFGPHETNLGQGRAISERHVAYYARRSAGGAGVLVTETASVHDSDWPYERAPLAQDCAPGWAAVAKACQDQGTLVLAGLGHTGAQGSTAFSQQALWAPSRVADAASREMPVAMEKMDIDLLVAGFVRAARLAVESGLAGVEIDAGVGALLRQFHSGLTNLRDDAYGQDRLMLTREVLSAIREETGSDFVVSLRLSCDELAPWAGVTPEMALEQVRSLAPLLDLLVVVQGGPFTASAYRPDAHAPAGHTIELCRQVSDVLDGALPVVLQGGVVDPRMAQSALDDGVADLVEMTRAQIADADLVTKVRVGAAATVRPCVRCNQTCRVRDNRNPVVACIGDPRSGHETVDVDVESDTSHEGQGHRVLVVGAGPAGLECARVLAARGASVQVVDAADRTGGMLPVVAAGRETFGHLSDWLMSECDRLGVNVALESRLDPDDIRAALISGQSVVLATGSRAAAPRYRIDPGATVITATDLLNAASRGALSDLVGPGSQVLVNDPVGGPVGVAVVELLTRHGHQASILTQDQIVGTGLSLSGDLADANTRLQQAGVVRILSSLLRAVTVEGAVVEQRWTREQRLIPTDLVVDAGHRLPEEQLYDALVGAETSLRDELVRAGDCIAPRTVHEAILEGRRAALTVLSRVAKPRPRSSVRLEVGR